MANPNPDPNNNTPNQNTKPVDTSSLRQYGDKTVDFSGIELEQDTKFASRIGKSSIGASSRELQNFDWAKVNEKIRNGVVEQEYDGLWSGAGKWVGSTLNSAATYLLDIGGALFDPADWRLPDVPDEVDSGFRETRKGGYVNSIFKWLDNNTIFGDTEDVTGNWMTRTASDWREYNEIYRTIKSGNEYADFWLNGSANIVGSAIGTLGYGTIMKTTLQGARWGLRAAQGINATQQAVRAGEGITAVQKALSTGAGAFLMTQATGMSIAQGVHDEVYKQKLYDLSPNLKNAELSEYQKIYDETLAKTKNAKDAEYAARMGVKEFRKNFASENPELHASAIKSAGKGAEASLQMMFPAFLLNLSISSAFTKAFIGDVSKKVTRNIISKSPYSKRALFWEGAQETVEEAGVENIAEDYGTAVGLGKDYTISDAWNKVMSWDNLGTAALAFVGGTATKGVIDFAGSGKHRESYEKQQNFIKRWNEIGASVGMPDVVEQLTAPVRSARELNTILGEISVLESQGKTEEAKQKSKQILALQAYDAYQSGTTQILIDNWTQIANNKEVKPEARQAAAVAVQEIIAMENDFNESLKYENGRSVFKNRANQKQDAKLAQEIKNKIAEKRNEAQLEVALLRQAGKLDLGYDYTVGVGEPTVNEETGELVFPSEKTERGELELELTNKGYVSATPGRNADKQIQQIKESVKPYQELLDLQEELEATEIRIAQHNETYAKMTDKGLQKNLKYQNMVLQEYESMKGNLEELLGTDVYMQEVDSKILNHYKNKMTKDSFENFRKQFFVSKNNKEKVTKELAEKAQLEEGLKSNKDIEEETKKADENSVKEIPFTNLPKETKIELVARKLAQNKPLTADEERFKNSNSIKVENKRADYEKQQASGEPITEDIQEQVVGEEGTVTDEKSKIANNISGILNEESEITPEVKTESDIDTVLKNNNLKISDDKKALLEKELAKENPNQNLVAGLLGNVKKSIAQQIINEYKLNQQSVDNNTDVELINFVNDIKQQIENSGNDQLTIDLEVDEQVDEFGNIISEELTEEAKKQLDLIQRLQANNNSGLDITKNKTIPNRYKFQIPVSNDPKESSDAAVEKESISYDPKEVNSKLSPEARARIKQEVGDYLVALEDELGSEPSFEKFIRDYIVNSNKDQVRGLFNTLILGWELNGMPIDNYQAVFDKVFRSRKEMASSLLQFAEEQNLMEQQAQKQADNLNKELNSSKTPVETASGEMATEVFSLGDTIFRFGYNSTNKGGNFKTIENEDGSLSTILEEYEEEDVDNFLKFKKLLRRDKFNPGTQLNVQVAANNADILIKDRDANGKVKVTPDGKAALISFKDWVVKNVKEKGNDFLKSQAYYDAVPLTIIDNEGDAVSYIHDVSKIETNDKLNAEDKKKQLADLRALRKYIIDTNKKGGTPKIEITAKTGGMIEKFPNNEKKRIRSINKNAVLARAIVSNGQITHMYVSNGNKSFIIPFDEFKKQFKIDDNQFTPELLEQLKYGHTIDVRQWDADSHKILTTDFPKVSEELVDSLMNLFSVSLTGGANKNNLITNLKKLGFSGSNMFFQYTNKFVRTQNPTSLANNKSYIHINDEGTKLRFGVKGGKEFTIENENDLKKYETELRQFLSEQYLNVKNNFNNPDINSSEFKMGLINEDGSIEESSNYNYFEYSMKDAQTDIRLENAGTADKPHFITRFQPNIEFKAVAPPNRNSAEYSSPKTETKEENKQLNNLVASTYTDEQLQKQIPLFEEAGWEFIGSTIEEKVEDAKRLLSENTNESTEFAKQLDDNLKKKLEQKPVQTPTSQESNVEAIAELKRKQQEEIDKITPIKNEKIIVDTGDNLLVELQVITFKDGSIQIATKDTKAKRYNNLSNESIQDYLKFDFELDAKGIIKTELVKDDYTDKESQKIKEAKEKTINERYDAQIAALESQQKTEETQTPLEGFEEFFNIFAESSNVDEAIQKLIDNKTITKDCK